MEFHFVASKKNIATFVKHSHGIEIHQEREKPRLLKPNNPYHFDEKIVFSMRWINILFSSAQKFNEVFNRPNNVEKSINNQPSTDVLNHILIRMIITNMKANNFLFIYRHLSNLES
ncbi:CLUMA_CG018540, isoform A [Clunio marinus]|uniref:CLUMA_CG018540, isoform A n=1 Tax=Clunio marinus TaxID=568069 RepID=A0A1J1J0S4_9DIPT|nr:CLUMA_CG018540, isoform A [Clunio marinus]